MWICLNDAFLSVVKKDCAADEVMIRARRAGDLEKVFNDEILLSKVDGLNPVVVTRYTKSDYLYRAPVKITHLKAALAFEVERIVYTNFKASTRDPKLHSCYNRMWHAHADLQELPPYSGNRGRAAADLFEGLAGDFGSEVRKPAGKGKKAAKK